MSDPESVIVQIRRSFADNLYPGDAYLQGSFQGDEPFEEVGPFRGQRDWQAVAPSLLDAHSEALSFFSEAGFRFFLPAFLVADLQGRLERADPLFHLTHGFSDIVVPMPVGERTFRRTIGRSALINPLLYGAMTSFDYARYRLSIFTREEAAAIVAYLAARRDADDNGIDAPAVDAALEGFWHERSRSAPSGEDLARFLREQTEYLAALEENGS